MPTTCAADLDHRNRSQVPSRPARHRLPVGPRQRQCDQLDPFVAEVGSATWDGARGFAWADGARRFESWENSYVNVLGLGAAVRQTLELGPDQIGEPAFALGHRLRQRLDELPHVSTHDLGPVRCAIVTARVENRSATEVAAALARAGDQRLDHASRGQPVRHRGPRRTPARPALPALLQHRGRDRPSRGRDRRAEWLRSFARAACLGPSRDSGLSGFPSASSLCCGRFTRPSRLPPSPPGGATCLFVTPGSWRVLLGSPPATRSRFPGGPGALIDRAGEESPAQVPLVGADRSSPSSLMCSRYEDTSPRNGECEIWSIGPATLGSVTMVRMNDGPATTLPSARLSGVGQLYVTTVGAVAVLTMFSECTDVVRRARRTRAPAQPAGALGGLLRGAGGRVRDGAMTPARSRGRWSWCGWACGP